MAKPPAAKPATPNEAEQPQVERGDQIYFAAGAGVHVGKVLSHGKDGCTVECKGRRMPVRWSQVKGHKLRAQPALSIVDEGEDGFLAKDGASGRLRYVHDPLTSDDEDEGGDLAKGGLLDILRTNAGVGEPSPIERLVAMRHEQELGKAIKNAPGLSLREVTDRSGNRTKRWMRNTQDLPARRDRPAPKPKPQPKAPKGDDKPKAGAGAAAGYGTHNLEAGDEVSFELGAFKGEGKIVASGAKGARIQDETGHVHKVDWTQIRGHKKPKESARLVLPAGDGGKGGGKGGGKKPPAAATGGEAPKPEKPKPSQEPIPAEKFVASNYAKAHDDPDATPESILAEFPPDTAAKIEAVQERLAHVEQTIDAQKRDGRWTEQRRALHRQILYEGVTTRVVNEDTGEWEEKTVPGLLSPEAIKAATPEPGQDPVFTMLGGRGGSGKSWFSKQGKVVDASKCIFLDSDHIKSLLPEYEGWNAAQVHEESGQIFDMVTEVARSLGLNVCHDATMSTASKAVGLVKAFQERGYRTEAHYMHLPRQEAAKRAVGRFLGKSQRYVPVDVVLGMRANEDSFDKVRQHVDKWSFRDNNVPKGSEPILISEGGKSGGTLD